MNEPTAPDLFFEKLYRRYLDGLLTNDRQLCRASFVQWLDATPDLPALYEGLVRRSLYEVGELWEQGKISVAPFITHRFASLGDVQGALAGGMNAADYVKGVVALQ